MTEETYFKGLLANLMSEPWMLANAAIYITYK